MLKNLAAISGLLILLLGTVAPGAQVDDTSKPVRFFGLGDVRIVSASPDLRFLATAGLGGAFLWDAQTGTLLHRLESNWTVTAVVFSPDSKVLFGSSGAAIQSWDAETGRPIRNYLGHRGEVSRLKISPDGRHLISASADNTARVWSIEAGAEIHSIRTSGSPILDISISPDGQRLATVDTFLTNCVKVWDIANESQIRVLPKTNWTASLCLFTSDGKLITAAPDGSVLLWNIDSPEPELIRSYSRITGPIASIMDLWFPNETTLAAACNNGSIYLWNSTSAALLRTVPGDPVIAALGVPNDHLIIAAHADHNVRVRQLPGGDTIRTFKGHTTSTHSGVAFSPDGRYVLSGGTEAATRLWDRQTGRPIREFIGSGGGTATVAFSADGSRVLTTIGLPNPAARLWKTATGELEREFTWTGSWPACAALSRDGTKIAVGAQDDRVRLFDVATGSLIRTLIKPGWISRADFSPKAPLLACASSDSSVTLYNHETSQALHDFFADAGPVTALAFSPSGDTLLIAWQDGLIRLFDTQTMDLRQEIINPAAFLDSAAFSPDGRYLLTGESFPLFTATLWDVQAGQSVRTFSGHKWVIGAVAFSSSGASILTGAEFVREWSIADLLSRIQITSLAGQVQLTWSHGRLECADQPQGPWETLANAVSPFTTPANEPASFYRVRTESLD